VLSVAQFLGRRRGGGGGEGGITDLAIGWWLEEEGGGFQLVKTKQIHKLMLTMFDPEEI